MQGPDMSLPEIVRKQSGISEWEKERMDEIRQKGA